MEGMVGVNGLGRCWGRLTPPLSQYLLNISFVLEMLVKPFLTQNGLNTSQHDSTDVGRMLRPFDRGLMAKRFTGRLRQKKSLFGDTCKSFWWCTKIKFPSFRSRKTAIFLNCSFIFIYKTSSNVKIMNDKSEKYTRFKFACCRSSNLLRSLSHAIVMVVMQLSRTLILMEGY